MKWLARTHGVGFELIRHFLSRMLDGEWSSAPGQWRSAAIGLISLFLPAGLLLIREGSLDVQYGSKYRLLAMAGRAADIRAAALADELALLTLLLCVTGLIALLQWQSLFPSGRDYLALASLPVRSRHIFAARFATVLLFSAMIVAAVILLPSLIAPVEFGGGWRLDASYWAAAGAQALAGAAGCLFVFFAIVALQGILLNVLPAGLAARFSVYVQGALVGLFLLGGFYSWTVKEWTPDLIARLPRFGAWLPPVWFAGLHSVLAGTAEAFSTAMARRAAWASAAALLLSALTYLACYGRYRKLLLETPVRLATPRVWRWSLIRLLARSPRREAAMGFMVKTLARSRTHRLLWLVYLGATVAVLLNSSLIDGALLMPSRGWSKAVQFLVLFWPLACSVIMLNGFRHVLSIPAELRSNWIFQISESQCRAEWMSAVERFIVAYAIAPIYLILFPVAAFALGWPLAIRMAVLQLLVSLAIFELLFYSWQKLPFTCSYIPGQKPPVVVVGQYIAMLCAMVPCLTVMVGLGSMLLPLFPFYLALFGGVWIWLRGRRRQGWGEAKLLYEDVPAVVTDLGIKELTYAGIQRQLRRPVAGDAGYADSEDAAARPDAWLRGGGVYSADLRGCAEGGGGSALPGAASPGTARPAGGGVGSFGQQPESEVLSAHAGGPQTPGGRERAVAANVGGDRPDHGASLGAILTGPWLRLRALFRRRQLDRDLEDELAFHLAMRQANGLDAPAARRRFGNLTSIKEACREMWTFGWIESLWQDVRYALRQIRVNRGFAAVTAVTLGIGIGATTTIYSLCDLMRLRLHLPHPETAVAIEQANSDPHSWSSVSPGDMDDMRKGNADLANLASWRGGTSNMVDPGGEALRVDQVLVSANFFEVVGVSPAVGRGFLPGEDTPGRGHVLVMTDRLWRARFHADPGIVGRTVRVDRLEYTVVGVMPPKFLFPHGGADMWTPLALSAEERASRVGGGLDSIARLRPGRTARQVQAELDALAPRLEKLHPQTNTGRRFLALPFERYALGYMLPKFLATLLSAAIFVLLIACVNVANLQFARGTARWREVALRQALGAGRWRIVVQLVVESSVLSLAGVVLGIVLARWGTNAIRGGIPAELRRFSSTMFEDLGINIRVLAVTLAAGVLSGIVAGLAPALRSSRPNLTEALKEGSHGASLGPGRLRLRSLLLVAEIALTVVLLVGAGLMFHGFQNLANAPTPVEPKTVLTLRLDLTDASLKPEEITDFYRRSMERIAAVPGVQAVTAASYLPFNLGARYGAFQIRGRQPQPGRQPSSQIQVVGPDYFRTLRIPLRAGRVLSDRDGPHTAAAAVISEKLAGQWWPGEPAPLGRQIRLGADDEHAPWITIVGVVGDLRAFVLETAPRPTLYLSYTQFPERGMDIAIRAARDPLTLAPAARAAIRAVDAGQPVNDVQTLERMRMNQAIAVTYMASLMGVFGAIALVLSCVGIYGMTAYTVARRSHEIGIRMALGASGRKVVRLFFVRGARAALAGMAIGMVLALGFARLLRAAIWGVSATDPGAFLSGSLLLAAAIALAIYLPARRAVRIDPIVTLRSE